MTPMQAELLRDFQTFISNANSADGVMEHICEKLHQKMTRYNWVGFYVVDLSNPSFLVVGPYAGSFTPNVRIPLDTGLCGAAATSKQTVIVNNVANDPRYLAGSSMVNSEIVVPILSKGQLAAEIDVESYFADTFTRAEQEFVEACATLVGKFMEKLPATH